MRSVPPGLEEKESDGGIAIDTAIVAIPHGFRLPPINSDHWPPLGLTTASS
jgi:hypothetical protein